MTDATQQQSEENVAAGADASQDESLAYNGEFRPAADRTEQSPEDLELAADVEEAMRDVVDPELGINVVDLGLVYDIWIHDKTVARIDMTLTSAACPLTEMIEDQAHSAVVDDGPCTELELNWVWMPPWGPEKITDDGREQLRALGFTI